MNYPDHPDIVRAMRTGCASWQSEENQDCEENRLEFAKENSIEFLKFVLGYDKSILDDFIEQNSWRYKSWLN